jgi:starch-binding outer membrane protein, SusD/RagB family
MKKYIILIILITTILFTRCKKLDLVPKDTISDATFWKTAADYKLAANNLYISLEDFDYESDNYNYSMDTESDIAFDVPNSISNGTYQAVESDNEHWTYPWYYIRRCNNIIEKATTSSIGDGIMEYVAEARFFRAYNYWKMFRIYGELPLITKVLDIDSPELYGARATRKETVDMILQDLTDAAIDLPEQSDLESADIGRITKGAAVGLKARVALFEGTWEKFRNDDNANEYLDTAIEASATVMNSNQYSLFNSMGDESYRYLFIEQGDDASECILDHRYARDINGHIFNRKISEGNYLVTKKLADMYLCTDGLSVTKSPLFQGYNTHTSEFESRDPRMSMTIIIPGTLVSQTWYVDPVASWPFYPQRNSNTGYTTYKHLSEDSYANALNYNWSYDNHILRYAEILLIFAEATYEKNGAISDAELNKSINLIRQRVNMPSLTNAFVTSNGLVMREEIRRERTVELALEGFRYDDLRRWKTAETELPQAIEGIKIVGTQWTDPVVIEGVNRNPYADQSWQTATTTDGFIIAEEAAARRFDPDKHYLRPIPTKEIQINPNLKQNPNW